MNWKTYYDFFLAAAFLLAAHKIMVAAMEGRREIRLFRYFGVAMAMAWSVFFVGHAIDDFHNIVEGRTWSVIVRILMTSVAAMFLVWGFLFNEKKWDARGTDDQ